MSHVKLTKNMQIASDELQINHLLKIRETTQKAKAMACMES